MQISFINAWNDTEIVIRQLGKNMKEVLLRFIDNCDGLTDGPKSGLYNRVVPDQNNFSTDLT